MIVTRNTARIYGILPLEGEALEWQMKYTIPLVTEYENPSPPSESGDLSYWSPKYAFCIFYGASQPVLEVNHIGQISENRGLFREVVEGDPSYKEDISFIKDLI